MKTNYDYLIIGAGPAGLQLGYFLEQNNRDYLILEKASNPGAFFQTYPRHRKLISINKVYTGIDDPEATLRWDWNSLLSDDDRMRFKHYSQRYFPNPDDLVRYLADFAQHYQLKVKYDAPIVKINKVDGRFMVADAAGNTYSSQRLVIATGFAKTYEPSIPGVELCDTYANHSIDPEKYANKRILVVGKGNSAFETAEHLTEVAAVIHVCSPHSIRFAWQSHYVGHLRAVNNNFLDTYQLKSQNTVIDASITKIERQGDQLLVHLAYTHAKGQTACVPYDHVIFCTGFHFDASIFDQSCRPELVLNNKFPAQTTEWESTNVPDLYFAGTLMHACDYRKTMSGFIHGFRYNIRTLTNIFEQKYHGRPWPYQILAATPAAVLAKVIDRVNRGSAMFLQPGFLGDVVVIAEEDGVAKYYEDIRLDHIPNSFLGQHRHFYTVSLEYGHFRGDPFSIERDPDPDKGHEAAYLHPVIRRYNQGMLVAEHHINDDLENQWYKEIYVQPAREFFNAQLVSASEAEPVMG